ncbi:MAG: LPD38 domain-containing protein [Candidatus Thorarchaeota archaeon]
MYRQYFKDPEVKRQIAGKPRTLLERIQRFFERFVNSLQGIGFDDASSVVRQIGTVQSRSRGEVRTLRGTAIDNERVSAVQEFSARQRESGGERRQQAAEPEDREEGERKPIVRYSIDSSQNLLDDDGNPSEISSLIENDGGYVDILDDTGRSVGGIGANVMRQKDFEDLVSDEYRPIPVGTLVIAHQGIEEKDALGKGYGKRAFKKLADAFLDRGSMVSSDGLVSEEASFIYRSLARDGYDVRVHPEARFDPELDNFYITDDLDPVLSVPFLDSNLDRKASDVTSLKEYPLDPDGNALYDGGVFVVMSSPANAEQTIDTPVRYSIPDQIRDEPVMKRFIEAAESGRYDVRVETKNLNLSDRPIVQSEVDANPANYRFVVYMEPKLAPGWKEHPNGRFIYDERISELVPTDNGFNRVTLKPNSGYSSSVPFEQDSGYVYRGVSYEEMQFILREGKIESTGSGSFESQQGQTSYTRDPATAGSYGGSFSSWDREPTNGRPGYLIKVKLPESRLITDDMETVVEGYEVGVRGPVFTADIESVSEIRALTNGTGKTDIMPGRPGDRGSRWVTGSAFSPSGSSVFGKPQAFEEFSAANRGVEAINAEQTIDTPSDAMFALTDKATFDEETGVWSDFDFEYVEQSNSDYLNDLINKHIPTEEQLKSELRGTKPEKAGVISDYEDGKIVDLRIDIPFYTDTLSKLENGLYAVTAHEPGGNKAGRMGSPIAYESMVKLKGPVEFGVKEGDATKLFKGERRAKTTLATVRGALDLSDQDADIRTRFPDDINEWVPVGMNPHKAVFFYDKTNGREIVEGNDAISVGNTVYTRLTDESYGPRTATEAFDSRLSLVETREEGESDADAILRQSVEGQDPSGSVDRGLTQTGEEYMKTPGFIPRVSIGKPVTADPDIMYSISRPIANGEREPIPLSPNNARRVEFNTDPERTSGNRSYDVIEASVSPPLLHKSLWESIKDVLTDRPLSWFRQKFIDKYEGIRKVVEKARELRGDDSYLLAGMDALKAAYLSDKTKGVAQEAITSGQLIYRDGITVVDTEKKGLVEILQPLFDIDQNLISTWHTWMIANREGRFEKEGRMVQMSAQERQTVFDNAQSNGLTELFESVNRDYQEWNGAVVDYMVATGVVNEQMGEIFKKYGDYIPFYREFEGEADERLTAAMQNLIGDELSAMEADGRMPPMTSAQRSNMPSSMFGSLTGVKPPRRAKGGDSMVVDPLTGIMRNLEAAVASGMKNVAATRVMDDAVLVGMATEVDRGQARADTHSVRMDGEDRFFDVFDPLLHDSLSGMHEGRIKYLNFFAAPAQFLREMVTRSPDFIMANLLRDSLSTWTTAGGTKPIVDTMKNFFGGENDSYNALKSAGIISGFDNSKTSKDLAKKFSNKMRAEGQTPGRKIPFWSSATKLWDWSGDVSTKSDAATRQSVYESVLQELLESGVSQGQAQSEAIYQAAEVINFSRRGNSALAKIITAVIPFMNARVQGLDLLYRAGTGKYSTVNNITRNRALIGFLSRASLLATTSLMYAGMIEDEDEYKSASPQVRDDNWIIPGFGLGSGFKIPVPFEIGFLFKTVPERVYHYYSGDQNYKQSVDAITRGVVSTLEFNPFGAQISKPAMEAMMNHSFYTGTSIVPWYLEQAEAKYQRRLGTNELASTIADTFNASPMKVEHVLRGYTGTLGGYILTVADWGMRELKGLPARPTLRADQMMVARRFLQSGEGSRGALSEWYEFRNSARGMLNAFNSAKKDGDIEKARRIFEENSGVISQKPAINQIDNMISKLRRAERYILIDQRMTPDEKAEAIKRIDVARNTIYEASKSVMRDSDLSPKFPFPFSVFNG